MNAVRLENISAVLGCVVLSAIKVSAPEGKLCMSLLLFVALTSSW